MLKYRKLLMLVVPALVIGTAVIVLFQQGRIKCDYLLATQPYIDVFPGSEILYTTPTRTGEDYSILASMVGATEHGRVVTVYVTEADFKDIVSFFRQQGECYDVEESINTACHGTAEPFGSYYISIDPLSSPKTRFTIQLDWSLCGSEL